MSKINAVLFDIDGTLLDTRNFIYSAFKYSLKKHHQILVTDQQLTEVMGKPLKECYQILSSLESVDHFYNEHINFQAENLQLSVPYKGTREVLAKLKKMGIKIGAVTTRHTSTLYDTLRLAKILHFFDVVIDADMVTNHKPHPESIFKALKVLKTKPDQTLMVGDTEIDIQTGENAKVKTVGATYGFLGQGIINTKPDFIIDDISQLIPLLMIKH